MMSDDLMGDHIVQPSQSHMDEQAVAFYNLIRASNPHLPEPEKIVGNTDLELTWSGFGAATLNMTVFVDLPEEAKSQMRSQS